MKKLLIVTIACICTTSAFAQTNSNGYRGATGTQYQYDLSRPGDQLQYSVNPSAQLRDEMNVDPRVDLDRSLGQSGGGVRR